MHALQPGQARSHPQGPKPSIVQVYTQEKKGTAIAIALRVAEIVGTNLKVSRHTPEGPGGDARD